jgi:hypothetical protein
VETIQNQEQPFKFIPRELLLIIRRVDSSDPSVDTRPQNLRVSIWRTLQKLGAMAIEHSVYVLPANERTHEDFQWLKPEIEYGVYRHKLRAINQLERN